MAKIGKHELIQAVRDGTELSKADCETAVDTVVSTIKMALQRGDGVELRGFGNFTAKRRAASTGRNPRTGETIQIAARNVAHFKASKTLMG